ncbi:MAG: riboflavin synthase [Patescibacteria group bacterium]|nr:riboflavin synthase [Patescibacteria group bacterium]
MFTGIIENLGQLKSRRGAAYAFTAGAGFCRRIKIGDSIAVNGACLTATSVGRTDFTAEVMPETRKRTTLGKFEIGAAVNLEFPATLATFLSGHLLQGHIDGVGRVVKISRQGNSRLIQFALPKTLANYVVKKGSVAVNGVSLTVIAVKNNRFSVGVIPHTWRHTSFRELKTGDLVNLETDVLAKYLEKLVAKKQHAKF